VPEQGDDAAVRQIVQANSASPHFVGAAITSAKGKEPMESPPTVSRKKLTAESDEDLMITFTSSEDEKEEEYSDNDCGVFGSDSSSSDIDLSDHDDQEEEVQASDDQEEAQAADDQQEEVQASDDQEEAQAADDQQEEVQASDDQQEEEAQAADDQQDDNIPPAELYDYLHYNSLLPELVYMLLANTPNDYIEQLQAIMKEHFDRLDFEPKHPRQMITYANFINNQVHKRTGSTTFWITLHPWSKFAWLWGSLLSAPCPH